MFFKSVVFKAILGGVIGITAATGAVYFAFVKPSAPTYVGVTAPTDGGCEPVVTFRDSSQNEDDFRLYRRGLGTLAFSMIHVFAPAPGTGTQISYTDVALPPGSYEYKVGAYNQYGESFSGIIPVTVPAWGLCLKLPPIVASTVPMNPVIVRLDIIDKCSVRITFRDNSTNEQGLRIMRLDSTWGVIATLGPHAGIPGTYDDKTKLPAGDYWYAIVAFNQSGESHSNTAHIEVNPGCNPAVLALPTVDALVFPTAQKQSSPVCNWQAASDVALLRGPSAGVYDQLMSVQAGKGFPVIGQSQDGGFWAVEVAPGVTGYIPKSEKYSLINGDCFSVPTTQDPPPPVRPTPRKKVCQPSPGNVCP